MIDIQLSMVNLLVGLVLAVSVAGAAWWLGMLSVDGWVAAILVGGLTYGLGGLPAAVLLITFFAFSSLISMAFLKRTKEVLANFAKGGRRDWAQVAANGGVAVISLALAAAGWISAPSAWVAFAAALSAVTADTWATEVGVLSARQPFLITSGKLVPPGTSGGVTLLGSSVALLGAMLISTLAWVLGLIPIAVLPLVTMAGLLGSFSDSALGATVQAIYWCPQCQKETERYPSHHCGSPTRLYRGWRWLDNDWVNFLSSLAAALLAAALFTWFV